jgi:pimeloyl-ACP methyl ester carboxylesterase
MNKIMPGDRRYLDLFCTPIAPALNGTEIKALEKSDRFTVRFEESDVPCYAWGKGRTVLLCHGWSSRAGHLLLLASALARFGFKVVAFDAPAHRSLPGIVTKSASSMFEFARAIATVARGLDDVYGLIGHSLGAMAALFAMAGVPPLNDCSFHAEKLVLMSAPAALIHVISNFCRTHGFNEVERGFLENELESAFSMSIARYDCAQALGQIDVDALIVQDENDDQFSTAETLAHCATGSQSRVFMTTGLGHDRVLASRPVFAEIRSFLEG